MLPNCIKTACAGDTCVTILAYIYMNMSGHKSISSPTLGRTIVEVVTWPACSAITSTCRVRRTRESRSHFYDGYRRRLHQVAITEVRGPVAAREGGLDVSDCHTAHRQNTECPCRVLLCRRSIPFVPVRLFCGIWWHSTTKFCKTDRDHDQDLRVLPVWIPSRARTKGSRPHA